MPKGKGKKGGKGEGKGGKGGGKGGGGKKDAHANVAKGESTPLPTT